MKKTITPFCLLLMLIACNKTTNDEKKASAKKSFFLNESDGYRNQLPLFATASTTASLNMAFQKNFDAKLHDKTVTYETFEQLYTPDLTLAEKQYLAFIILAKKDFIGHVRQHPTAKADIQKMKAYITLLVENKYIGYCVLYNALQSLPATEKDFVHQQYRQIALYADKDTITPSILEAASSSTPATAQQKKVRAKFAENKRYLNLIKAAAVQ